MTNRRIWVEVAGERRGPTWIAHRRSVPAVLIEELEGRWPVLCRGDRAHVLGRDEAGRWVRAQFLPRDGWFELPGGLWGHLWHDGVPYTPQGKAAHVWASAAPLLPWGVDR